MLTPLASSRMSWLAPVLAVGLACSVSDGGLGDLPDAGDGDEETLDAAPDRPSGTADRPSGTADRAPGSPDGPPAAADRPVPDAPVDRPPDERAATPDAAAPMDAARLPRGAGCTRDGACASGFCVDGVCCESRCERLCAACARNRTGADNGLCRPVAAGTDPDGECPDDGAMTCRRNGSCDGAGACALYAMGTPCGQPSCMGSTYTPTPRCSGSGACQTRPPQPCPGSLVCESATACKARCASDADCTGELACDTATGQCRGAVKKPNGQTCDAASECTSGFCVDGVCCDSACQGTCRACAQAKTGQADGQCAVIPAGQDPDRECPRDDPSTCGRDGSCDGNGACRRYPDGTICASDCCRMGGGGTRPCTYACMGGSCDRGNPTVGDRCGVGNCCCPGAGQGGIAACVPITTCGVSMCQ